LGFVSLQAKRKGEEEKLERAAWRFVDSASAHLECQAVFPIIYKIFSMLDIRKSVPL
jgi:hypothetical protein